jgi:hypothetical protein
VKRALITTTINVPTNLMHWAPLLDAGDLIVVAGDLKTPHDEVRKLLAELESVHRVRTLYLAPGDTTQRYATHSVVGYNSIQRRNLALLEALRDPDWDYLITVDDDNYPEDSHWVVAVDEYLFADDVNDARRLATSSGWFNVGELCHPRVTHRGYPLEQRHHVAARLSDSSSTPTRVGVFASLWLGDPDIDAIERAVLDPCVEDIAGSVTLDAGTWCPFNSQATAYRRELAPIMYMWPHVGRMDDIWSSLAARAVMDVLGWHVRYGRPAVWQERNAHDVATDISNELIGYRYTTQLAEQLRDMTVGVDPTASPVEAARTVYARISNYATMLPARTIAGFSAWFSDLESIGVR